MPGKEYQARHHGQTDWHVRRDRRCRPSGPTLPFDNQLLDAQVETIVFRGDENKLTYPKSVESVSIDFSGNVPKQVCDFLHKRTIQSLIIEGGAHTLQHYINQGLWDEAYVFKGATLFKKGLKAPVLTAEPISRASCGTDILITYNQFD